MDFQFSFLNQSEKSFPEEKKSFNLKETRQSTPYKAAKMAGFSIHFS